MYSLLTPIRIRRARRAAVAVISPLLENSRWRLGSIPDQTWADPYVIGLMAMLITMVARITDQELDSDALGSVQILAWQDLTSQQPSTVGEDILILGQAPNADFALGCRDGARLAKLIHGQDAEFETFDLNSDAWRGSDASAIASQGCAHSIWSQCFDSHVTVQEQSLS